MNKGNSSFLGMGVFGTRSETLAAWCTQLTNGAIEKKDLMPSSIFGNQKLSFMRCRVVALNVTWPCSTRGFVAHFKHNKVPALSSGEHSCFTLWTIEWSHDVTVNSYLKKVTLVLVIEFPTLAYK